MRALVVFASVVLLSVPAVAQPSGGVMSGSGAGLATESRELPQETANTASAEEGSARRICRRVETASGSRMSYKRLCMTAEQWRTFNRQR